MKFRKTSDEKTEIMGRSFANFAADLFYGYYWYFTDTAPVSDPPKES